MNEASGTRVNDGKETTRDRALKWIEKYATENFGILIQCEICSKWRISYQYADKKEVPNNWQCSMLVCANEMKGKCTDTEEMFEDLLNIMYYPGSLVWAKYANYPWWPGMIDLDPDYIRFFEPYDNNTLERKFESDLSRAMRRAHAAEKLPIKERLKKYSFAINYKGPWPIAVNSDDDELNEETQETNATNIPSIAAGNNSTYDIINEQNVNKPSAVEGITTVPKKSVKNITEKERVSLTREKAESGLKHISENTAKESSKIINKVKAAVEETTEPPCKKAKTIIEEERTFHSSTKEKTSPESKHVMDKERGKMISTKERKHLKDTEEHQKKSSFVMSHNEPSPFIDYSASRKGTLSCKKIKEVSLGAVEETATVQRKLAEKIAVKEGIFPTGQKDKRNSGFKHRINAKELGENIKNKKRKLSNSKERFKLSNFVLSRKKRCPLISDCDNNPSRGRNVMKEVITVPRKLANNITEKERTIPNGINDRTNSGFKLRIYKEGGGNITKKEKKIPSGSEISMPIFALKYSLNNLEALSLNSPVEKMPGPKHSQVAVRDNISKEMEYY
ncbi:zinc finger CW-type PWWP domain protein 1 [Trichonephila clavipes]|nr:zinc finger CW-type PWWP domain protein 1 [Trichonephila clavipes]